MSCNGGAVIQLVSTGVPDAVLTGDPTVTFWRFVHKMYTNFAMEAQQLDFSSGTAQFGANPKCNLDRIGDIVYWMYFVADLPGIGLAYPRAAATKILSNDDDVAHDPVEPYWTHDVGHAMLVNSAFYIGGQPVDTIQSEFMFIWEELSGHPGKRLVEMTGAYKSEVALQIASRQPRRLYVPLPFWFTASSGSALPIVSLQFHTVAVSVQIRAYQDLLRLTWKAMNDVAYSYVLSDIQVRALYRPSTTSAVQPLADLSALSNNSLSARIEVCYVYLDETERAQFASGAFEQLMVEHQYAPVAVDQSVSGTNTYGSDKKVSVDMTFNHPISELFWVARRRICEKFSLVTTPEFNNWFDFSGPADVITTMPIDPVKDATVRLNGAYRMNITEGRYFRLVQPWQHHSNIPESFVYSYSFSLVPEMSQPSGSCNFSRIDNTTLDLTIDGRMFLGPRVTLASAPTVLDPSANSSITILVFATDWNVLRFKFGLAGVRFSS